MQNESKLQTKKDLKQLRGRKARIRANGRKAKPKRIPTTTVILYLLKDNKK